MQANLRLYGIVNYSISFVCGVCIVFLLFCLGSVSIMATTDIQTTMLSSQMSSVYIIGVWGLAEISLHSTQKDMIHARAHSQNLRTSLNYAYVLHRFSPLLSTVSFRLNACRALSSYH